MIRFRTATYREAGARDLARMVLRYLWEWIYRAGLTKQQVLDWFQRILQCKVGDSPRRADIIPTELRDAIARLLAQQNWNCGDFMNALSDALEDAPPGYRWKADKLGRHMLVKVRSDIGERAVVQGKRFADTIFIGIWWATGKPIGSANRRLQNYIKRQGGAIFWNERVKPDTLDVLPQGGRQYGAFVLVDRRTGTDVANTLSSLAHQVDLEGSGQHRLSAISLAGIAEHREVRNSDQVFVGPIRSIKFNWEYTLPDVLNGRATGVPYKELQRLLRER